jgi:hypothetical protein
VVCVQSAHAQGHGIQVTPDGKRVLISKDVNGQRWAITQNLDDGTVNGNVFFPGGGDPAFVSCSQTGNDGQQLTFSCYGASNCTASPCENTWNFINNVTLPASFFALPGGAPTQCLQIEGSRSQMGFTDSCYRLGAPGYSPVFINQTGCQISVVHQGQVILTGTVGPTIGGSDGVAAPFTFQMTLPSPCSGVVTGSGMVDTLGGAILTGNYSGSTTCCSTDVGSFFVN